MSKRISLRVLVDSIEAVLIRMVSIINQVKAGMGGGTMETMNTLEYFDSHSSADDCPRNDWKNTVVKKLKLFDV